MLRRVWRLFRWLIILPVVLVSFAVLFAALIVILFLVDLPRWIGHLLRFDDRMRWLVFRLVDAEEMQTFRDDYLHIIESEIPAEDMDRWGLLREIDVAQEKVERRLESGEFAISVAGGVASVGAGRFLGIRYAGAILTIVVIGFSLLVALRIVITDTLCYNGAKHRNEPIHRLVLMRAWNQGPVQKKGAVAVALLTIIAAPGNLGYKKGQQFVEQLVEWHLGPFEEWRAG